jgi:glutathione synthase/RimK-type ligase-like ATP-grasp enzyme
MKGQIKGMILYSVPESQLVDADYSVIRLLEAGRAKGIEMTVVTPGQFEMVVTRTDRKSILVDDVSVPLPDFVLPRLGANTGFYAFSVLRQLEQLGVYIANDAQAVYSVKDKLAMYQLLSSSRLSTPKTMLAKYPINADTVEREIGFPLVIKNVSGMQGAGIYLCESKEKFEDVLELIYSNNEKANIILQEFVKNQLW